VIIYWSSSMTLYAYPCKDEWLSSICMNVSYLYACLSLYDVYKDPTCDVLSCILRARVGKTVSEWSLNLDMVRCLTGSTDLTDVWHSSPICLMHVMILSSVWFITLSFRLPYAWPGRLFCHILNSFTHATNKWCIQCMLSIYDMLPIIDVIGARYDRWGAVTQ